MFFTMSCSCLNKILNFSHVSKFLLQDIPLKLSRQNSLQSKFNVLHNTKCLVFNRNSHNTYTTLQEKSSDFDKDLDELNNSYRYVRNALLYTDDKAISSAVDWSAKVLDYNVQGGKKNRGVCVLKAYKILSMNKPSSDRILEACLLGWCVEMLQAFFLVCDDIMDNSTTRRGKPCWYKKPDVGLTAVNDSLILEHGIYKILEMYFRKSSAYQDIVQEFLKVTRITVMGQTMDMLSSPPNQKPKFENFNLERYYTIVEYKTSHYTFCLPVHLGMHLNGNFSAVDFEITKQLCLKLGLLFQIQDDYLDVYGDPAITGKVGTDIIDGKCSWFAATAFEQAPESLKNIMLENYGVNNAESVSEVRKVFKEMSLVEKFYDCEQKLVKDIKNLMCKNISSSSLHELFNFLLQVTYRRKK